MLLASSGLLLFTANADAANLGSLLRKLTRVADDVPIDRLDDVVEEAATSRAGRELIERRAKRLGEPLEQTRALRNAWVDLLDGADDSMLKQIARLDVPSQQAALVVARGAKNLSSGIPDLASRSRFLREGGAETLAAVGRYDDLVDDAVRFDLAVTAGRLAPPAGAGQLTLGNFGTFFQQQGGRGHHFWTKYVRPRWKLWLGSAALGAVLLTPQDYLDDAGELTQAGFKKLLGFAGNELGSALAGIVEGTGEAAKSVVGQTVGSVFRTFFTSGLGLVTLLLAVTLAGAIFPPSRRRLAKFFNRIRGRRTASTNESTESSPKASP